MASQVRDKQGNFLVKFRYGGREFTRSLDTRDSDLAEAGVQRVEETLMRLKRGWLTLPPDAEAGIFIVSAGQLTAKPVVERAEAAPIPNAPHTAESLFNLYRSSLTPHSKGSNSLLTEQIHLSHLLRVLGGEKAFDSLTTAAVQDYVDHRAREGIHATTIRKELATLRMITNWAWVRDHIKHGAVWEMRSLTFPKSATKEPFKTWEEIETIIARNKPSRERIKQLWECLYLTEEQIKECLAWVEGHARYPFVYPMFTFCAYTGARRGEILRSEREDFRFKDGVVLIRESKADQDKDFTFRHVPIHPTLSTVMRDSFKVHPGGRWTICTEDGKRIGERMGTKYFRQGVRESKWEVLHGFHIFRHSLASIMASKGKDQRLINAILGHSTEDMERRYRHLFPDAKRGAIQDLF